MAFKLSGYALDRRHFRQEFYLIAGGIKVKHNWENLTAWDEIALLLLWKKKVTPWKNEGMQSL